MANEVIETARAVGLARLQPSKRELERGLALHRESLVVESYGFAPRAAVDGDRIAAVLAAGASGDEYYNLMEETSEIGFTTRPAELAEVRAAWEASGVTAIIQNAGLEAQDVPRLLERLAYFSHAADVCRELLVRATHPDDIVAAWRQGKRALYLSGNAVPLPQRWLSVEEELRSISLFFQLGIRTMHLTYNRRNVMGDGCAEPANGGLSDFGRTVIAELNRVGVIVDVAHAGWQTSLEAAQASSKPIVASHSAAAALHRHVRGKPDEVIRAIAKRGGYVGVCSIPWFLGRSGDIVAMLDHIDHIVRLVGADHVAIGTDVAYVSRNDVAERAKYQAPKMRPRFESFWPPDESRIVAPYRDSDEMRSMAWTNWPLFTVGLVQRGYSDEDIQKIIGGNVLRVARATLEGTRYQA